MSHVEAIEAVFEQFDGHFNGCVGCEIICYGLDCDCPDNCYENNLICRKKLIESAQELDKLIDKGINSLGQNEPAKLEELER